MTYKALFSKALSSPHQKLHAAAHSHHLWPNASLDGQIAAWHDAALWADRKWERIYGHILPEAYGHIAAELNLPDASSIVVAPNTHELVMRLFTTLKPGARVLTTDGEFHSFRRQSARLEEAGQIAVTRIPIAPITTFATRFTDALQNGVWDMVFVSHVFFNSGHVFDDALTLHQKIDPKRTIIAVDGYHGFMAIPTDYAAAAPHQYYIAGGYKYAMSGEGACFMHCPPGDQRPLYTGWYAEFDTLHGHKDDGVPYSTSAQRFAGSTFDPSAWYRFNAVQAMLAEEGLTTASIAAHVHALQESFIAAVQAGHAGALRDAHLLNPVLGARHARFLAFLHPQAQRWQHDLQAAGIITDVRGDVLRMGFGIYHDHSDIEDLIGQCAAVMT